MAFTRIIAGRSATLTHTFYAGATPTDPSPDNATVTIVRDDGTVLVPAGSVDNTAAGVAKITLTPAETAQLDRLRVTWTATLGNQAQSFTDTVEIAGDTLFTIAEARRLRPLDNATQYPDDVITAMRTRVEQTLEDACGVAFVPRYSRVTLSGLGTSPVRVTKPYLRRVRWGTVSGTALTTTDLAGLSYDSVGQVYGYGFPIGYGNVVLGVEHGMDQPPERVRGAALLLAKMWLISGPVDDRAATFSSDTSGATYSMVIPGRNGSWVGVPEVDAVIDQYRLPAIA